MDDTQESAETAVETDGGGPSIADRLTAPYRAANKFLGRRAIARATLAVPRTVRFMGTTMRHGEVSESVPAPALTLALAAQVIMDEALLAMAMAPNRFPRRADYERVGAELADARRMYRRRGWLAHPAAYHRTPPPLRSEAVHIAGGKALGLRYEKISYDSGFGPHRNEPGAARWESFVPNRIATANVVRHDDGPRPWVVCIHGFMMGYPLMDFQGLQTARLHRDLGVNVALPVLPLHGSRKVTKISGEPFMSFELMNAVHGLTQAVWDIRRLLDWIRAQGATAIGLYGVSLGGYVASLLASLDPSFDAVVVGIPVCDFPALFHEHSPLHVRARSIEHRILGGAAEDVYRVVSPFSFEPQVAHDRRFIFAGYGDRMARPDQARRLWEHWDKPAISWYAGNHVGYLWSRQVATFLVESLGAAGLCAPPPPR